ncbi:MAG TPA: hypothetical protein PLJ38_08800, partial [bacterium]|nr:hypothetical protein [bacterium]
MSKKSIFIFMMITLVSVFVNRISAAYEEPEISYSAIPEYILVGQTASVKYTITVPGYENIEGTIKITGTKAGKGISFKASAQKIKYKHYFPNGGWHYAAATITPEVSIDVVDIENLTIKKNPDKLAEYIGKPVAANASTNPPGYEYL